MLKRKKIIAALLAAATVFTLTPSSYTDVTAQAANWEINRLSPLEKKLYDKEIDFLTDILKNGGNGEISTKDSYVLAPSERFTGTPEEASKWLLNLKNKLQWYMYWNHAELLMWSNNDTEIASAQIKDGDRVTVTGIVLGWKVSQTFRTSAKPDDYLTLDGSRLDYLRKCIKNADAVLSKYAGLPDYQKMKAYIDWISDNNDYNNAAAEASNATNNDFGPWTMNYVFDNDPSTNVVCEGYARSFQYLMDHSIFAALW